MATLLKQSRHEEREKRKCQANRKGKEVQGGGTKNVREDVKEVM